MPVSLREFFAFRSDVRPNERSRAGALLVAMLALPRRGNGHGFAAGSGGTGGQQNQEGRNAHGVAWQRRRVEERKTDTGAARMNIPSRFSVQCLPALAAGIFGTLALSQTASAFKNRQSCR